MKLFRKPWLWWCFGGSLIVLFFSFFIWAAYTYGSAWPWTGFTEHTGPNTPNYQPAKTLWDWLQLLIIPAALALTAVFFNQANTRVERGIAQARYEQDQRIALDKQREDLLQAYIDRMSELLLKEGLRTSKADAEVRKVARTRTISVLRQLDARRVSTVFTFLHEAELRDASDPIISLEEADLSHVNWSGADLSEKDLRGAKLSGADLRRTDLGGAKLSGARLSGARLSGARLTGAFLKEAWLSGTDLSGADLRAAGLEEANLEGADLSEADLYRASLRRARISGAKLHRANLSKARISEVWLDGADLSGANFSETDFSGAFLKDAQIDQSKLTPEQIAQIKWDYDA